MSQLLSEITYSLFYTCASQSRFLQQECNMPYYLYTSKCTDDNAHSSLQMQGNNDNDLVVREKFEYSRRIFLITAITQMTLASNNNDRHIHVSDNVFYDKQINRQGGNR
ncbi:hypothetical protein TNIN_287981 [Trichonephila inaurata madagascariensis]|uniref:Uncharacterized protein n=1 Tax=Trichonephila inaurata madagascariensis TaxID=2747483 RepID=A0A8X6Y8M9_9ARAC|nr:hypothetical protein TNIN_287981 [Trichonephila inaurata madagascariensis]